MKIKLMAVLVTGFVSLGAVGVNETTLGYPGYFPAPEYNFAGMPLDSTQRELGRKLFYDPILSADNSTSCASCHTSYNAFAHTDHSLSHGINDEIGNRNAPALFNLAWQRDFMWDGAASSLEDQALAPIGHPKEMGSSMAEVVRKLTASDMYKRLFNGAFGYTNITSDEVLTSLAQFQRSIISCNARYDQVKQGKSSFTAQEENGYRLFLQHCNSCHTEPLFSNYQVANNGLPVDTTLNDFGRWMVTHRSEDSLLFKTPSLRNLRYSYPYMHDGRFKTVKQVVDYYMKDVQRHRTLSAQLKVPIILSPIDKVDLIAFLATLNDETFVFNPQYQYPR
ncbi:MAG: cytochrome-c peroxidase [Bacteroidota bacterium]